MAKMNVPAALPTKTTVYDNLRGVDFSVDPSLGGKTRSPLCINMISDDGSNPVKRLGWRTLQTLESPVHNIWYGEINGVDKYICHAGTKIYALDMVANTSTVLYSGVSNTKGTAFFMEFAGKGSIFILTGANYLVYDGTTVRPVSEVATIPTIIISRNPTGGGTVFNPVNLIQKKRINSFLGNGTDKIYQLTSTGLDSVDKVEYLNSSGVWVTAVLTTDYSVDLVTGRVTFVAVHAPVIAGQDNVRITFSKSVTGYAERIQNCTITAIYVFNQANYVFVSGNSSFKNQDWQSYYADASYFPDTNFAVVGSSDTAIMGYQKISSYLSIVKEDNQQDTTIFLRSAKSENGVTSFTLQGGIAGIGAISKNCFITLGDEPLFLSRTGVFATSSTLLSVERTTRNRSRYVDKRLTAETDLKNAVACEWNNYYILSVNTRCYVLDGRRLSEDKTGNSNGLYDAYYWINVPANCFLSLGGNLFFGTTDGRICRFNTDLAEGFKYYDNGAAVPCQWATPNDDDGAAHLYKTLLKKGGSVTLSPYDRSSGEIYFIVDGNPETLANSGTIDIFNWEDLDFERFTFDSNTSPREIYFNKKKKDYKRLQIIIRNEVAGEAFGIHQIVKTFAVGNYSRNKG